MKNDIDHLPPHKQLELERIKEILFREFADAIALGTSPWRRQGRIVHLILFGSYARTDWVDEPHTKKGYLSDYDLLIVVNHDKLTEYETFWFEAAEAIMHDDRIKTPVNFIVHSMDEVNKFLKDGHYFFSYIIEQGISLHEKPGHRFAKARTLTPAEALKCAEKHSEEWIKAARSALDTSGYCSRKGDHNDAAFLLHQSVERAYTALLLTRTNYCPPTHNIRALRSLAEDLDDSLIEAWPRHRKKLHTPFNKLVEAYVKARYSEHFTITEEMLLWLSERSAILCDLVEVSCARHVAQLAEAAGQEED